MRPQKDEKHFSPRVILGAVLLVGLLVATLAFTTGDEQSPRENGLLQFIFFAASVVIAIGIGRESVKAWAADVVRPHGRKAVRRIVTLASGLQGLSSIIQGERAAMEGREADTVPREEVDRTFDFLEVQINTQLRMVEDAVEDWRDVVPEEVEWLERGAKGS